MNELQIHQIIEQNAFPDLPERAELIETHISWVILATHFAFKIKRPMHYSFLDFSTLKKRKFYCEQEVKLNQRLTENMYLGVVPIYKTGAHIGIGGEGGEIIDYAVKMKRMDNSRQMNLLLEKGEVTRDHMHQLADKLAYFHSHAEAMKNPPDIPRMETDFADILNVNSFIKKELGQDASQKIKEAVAFSRQFLRTHTPRLLERHRQGFTIDGHGDLHSKNILLLDEPIVFDCIEFNSHFRQGDILNELAFFCMDLEAYGRVDLAEVFLEKYLSQNPCISNEEDQLIFQYFKLYRANVRLKVNALKGMSDGENTEQEIRLGLVRKYLKLLEKYMDELKSAISKQALSFF